MSRCVVRVFSYSNREGQEKEEVEVCWTGSETARTLGVFGVWYLVFGIRFVPPPPPPPPHLLFFSHGVLLCTGARLVGGGYFGASGVRLSEVNDG